MTAAKLQIQIFELEELMELTRNNKREQAELQIVHRDMTLQYRALVRAEKAGK